MFLKEAEKLAFVVITPLLTAPMGRNPLYLRARSIDPIPE